MGGICGSAPCGLSPERAGHRQRVQGAWPSPAGLTACRRRPRACAHGARGIHAWSSCTHAHTGHEAQSARHFSGVGRGSPQCEQPRGCLTRCRTGFQGRPLAGGAAGDHEAQRPPGPQVLQPRAEGPGATAGRPTSPRRTQEAAPGPAEQPSKVTHTDCTRAKLGASFETVITTIKKPDRLERGKSSAVTVRQGHGARLPDDPGSVSQPSPGRSLSGRAGRTVDPVPTRQMPPEPARLQGRRPSRPLCSRVRIPPSPPRPCPAPSSSAGS